ncbi:BTB/POZ and MATH domain-containing protein 2 [Dichanthelium oligosanthes]|uniref:BTB/POZ and MATH domain-containing protein 2 n=1 Tax=Dichanthelium oligosanthes TaxID=888268 RepID=A0A1E5W7E5_9POAL|nr:BTB/POZ and MATH domain-containing protein 2 [Dichanthelium oligosanthes]
MAAAAAAASQIRPGTRTASSSSPETARGTHAFKINRYSLHRDRGVGKFVRSATFAVGGYDWSIRFYPDGFNWSANHADYVGVFLEFMSTRAKARATFDFRLVDQATGESTVMASQGTPKPFFAKAGSDHGTTWGSIIMKRSELEASTFLRNDCLLIECDITVIVNESRVEKAAIRPGFEVQVPPSNLSDNLKKLLEEKQGADVTFKVQDEVFPVHKIVLAMRSPVFNAELFGTMMGEKNTGQCSIAIEDMHPDVFRALLHFIYTDTMPAMGELDDDDGKEMTKHLLVAADRYAMERLKLMCEAVLCKSLDVENVAVMTALADQHHCRALGDACAEFIASSNRIGNVVESQGYVHLKRVCPTVLVDMLERVTKGLQSCMR